MNFDERRMVEGGTMRAWGELALFEAPDGKADGGLRAAPGSRQS
ncbi:MAG: hypothetical protein ACLR5H_00075 [Oscillospiraceae bacterium]